MSILTHILPVPVFVRRAELDFPANRETPIAARLHFGVDGEERDLRARFDWREREREQWQIVIETAEGRAVRLHDGGAALEIDGEMIVAKPSAEYPLIYERFDALLRRGESDVDARPFRLVADAFMIGRRLTVDPFVD